VGQHRQTDFLRDRGPLPFAKLRGDNRTRKLKIFARERFLDRTKGGSFFSGKEKKSVGPGRKKGVVGGVWAREMFRGRRIVPVVTICL